MSNPEINLIYELLRCGRGHIAIEIVVYRRMDFQWNEKYVYVKSITTSLWRHKVV